jgi:hypothetical protein
MTILAAVLITGVTLRLKGLVLAAVLIPGITLGLEERVVRDCRDVAVVSTTPVARGRTLKGR